jgi:hypothetical protein
MSWLLAAALCLPPLPGEPEPKPLSEAEKARDIATTNRNIVYGTVTRGSERGGALRFKIERVYKGSLKRGRTITAYTSHGFYPSNPCAGMLSPLPVFTGAQGVIAFNDAPAPLNFIRADWLDEMVATRLIAKP